jgi:hypothetical protein
MSAFVHAVVRAALAGADGPADPEIESGAYGFVERQLARLPDFLRVPMRVAGHSIDAVAVSVYGRPFGRLDLAQQRYVIARARESKLGPVRDAVRFYESLAIFFREGAHADV